MQKSTELPGHIGLCVLTVFLAVLMPSSSTLRIEVVPAEPQVDGSVTLHVLDISDTVRFYEWYLGNNTLAENLIIRYNRDDTRNKGSKYFPEATIQSNGSLVIEKVQKNLEGNYTVLVQGLNRAYQETVFLSVTETLFKTGLSGGAIAGICIGILAVIAGIVGCVVYAAKHKSEGPL